MSTVLNKEEEEYLKLGAKKVVNSSKLSNDTKATILGAFGAVVSFAIPFINSGHFNIKTDWVYLAAGIFSALGGYITNKQEKSD